MLSWVQDSSGRNIAVSSSDPNLPYGTIVWSASDQTLEVAPSVTYQGSLNESMQVTYTENGRTDGNDYVDFLYGGREFESNDASKGCDGATPDAAWKTYSDPALANYETRHIFCTFAC
jgi:hypothetical protein